MSKQLTVEHSSSLSSYIQKIIEECNAHPDAYHVPVVGSPELLWKTLQQQLTAHFEGYRLELCKDGYACRIVRS